MRDMGRIPHTFGVGMRPIDWAQCAARATCHWAYRCELTESDGDGVIECNGTILLLFLPRASKRLLSRKIRQIGL